MYIYCNTKKWIIYLRPTNITGFVFSRKCLAGQIKLSQYSICLFKYVYNIYTRISRTHDALFVIQKKSLLVLVAAKDNVICFSLLETTYSNLYNYNKHENILLGLEKIFALSNYTRTCANVIFCQNGKV